MHLVGLHLSLLRSMSLAAVEGARATIHLR